ncbi:hypothetical protein HQ40_06625 [Porphyromonas gulae]|uniref:DUF1661 domain-containing protein n=1 Tax=Porphyromonas gulae TaxID=111105 RepID=UPI00052C10D6|nr:DUF1661 domain-containing protein [Porphyromonas gulae]KGN75323.1 hypothetical protein HQ40_06625 [Porphyromonas gulae]
MARELKNLRATTKNFWREFSPKHEPQFGRFRLEKKYSDFAWNEQKMYLYYLMTSKEFLVDNQLLFIAL